MRLRLKPIPIVARLELAARCPTTDRDAMLASALAFRMVSSATALLPLRVCYSAPLPELHSNQSMRKLYLLVIGIIVLGLVAFIVVHAGPPPTIVIEPAAQAIGQKTPVTVRVSEPKRGLSTIKVELVQGDLVRTLAEKNHVPAPAWAPWRAGTPVDELRVEAGRDTVAELKPGTAVVRRDRFAP